MEGSFGEPFFSKGERKGKAGHAGKSMDMCGA